jgi:putative ABC transport system ATP-binding protein
MSVGHTAVSERVEQPTVCVRHVNHYYGMGEVQKQVLFDNSLALLPGEIAIMTGPSGAGKTTLLTLIGALRSVQEGSVQVQGRELSGLGKRELVAVRQNIGFVFHAHNLFESLSAFENVMMALALHPATCQERQERAADILTRVGLAHRMHAKPQAMSGGQQQRVAIARALVHRPKLILADEPTAALDKDTGREIVALFQQLAHDEQATIVIVTHDHRILDVADRIINLVDGHIISNVAVQESVTVCEFLQQCPVFATLPPSTLTSVAEKMRRERFVAGSVIIR